MAALRETVLRRKPVVEMEAESGSETNTSELARTIGLFQLSMFGVGATIGTGIFIVLTQAVPVAGPAVILSFVIAGAVAGLTAICYAELAGAVPVSGSSYSYAYATLGELPAMVVAACLLLEYGVSGAAVAVGWSQYLNELLDNLFGFTIPRLDVAGAGAGRHLQPARRDPHLALHPAADPRRQRVGEDQRGHGDDQARRARAVRRHRAQGWNSDHLSDFAPFGLHGITSAAGIIFFSYIGLDAVSTAGEEVKDPHRTMPLAIIIALVDRDHDLHPGHGRRGRPRSRAAAFEGQEAGLSAILEDVTGSTWPATVAGCRRGRSRSSASPWSSSTARRASCSRWRRDGMMPELFHKLNPRTLTPVPNTIIVAIVDLAAGRR